MADGSKVLQQDEKIVFRAAKDLRIIDRIITLTAQGKDAVFHDSKEGAIAIRVTRALEEPSTKAEIFTDAAGIPTKVAKLDNTGVNGVYLSSEGLVGEKDAWSTRAKWMTLSGNVKGEDVCVGIFDHPKNSTYPTYWHCRGYGLFAANPFGAKENPKGNPSKKPSTSPSRPASPDLPLPHPDPHRQAGRRADRSAVSAVPQGCAVSAEARMDKRGRKAPFCL
jgi:hypothetical protein